MKILTCFIFLFVALLTGTVRGDVRGDLATLRERYAQEVTKAGQHRAYSTSAFRLAFSTGGDSLPQIIGNILRAIDLQEEELKRLESEPLPDNVVRPGNDFQTNAGLLAVEMSMAADCRHCTTAGERLAHAKAARALIQIYDIQGAGLRSRRSQKKFSGLPFFDVAVERFTDPLFQRRTITFYNALAEIMSSLTNEPAYRVTNNVYQMALKVCDNNPADAIELAGLLLSRDSNIIKYFSFMPKLNETFVRAAAMTPLLVQLVARFDEIQTDRKIDRFSFDGDYKTEDPRNYYFWSGAFVSEELRRRRISEEDISELNLQLARHYRILRWYEIQAGRAIAYFNGKDVKPLDQEGHAFQARRTMRVTGGGVKLSRKMAEQNCKNITEKL